jgi:hypothetical protein
MGNQFNFKSSQTFTIRNGWIPKAIVELEKNPKENVFSKTAGVVNLGIGANMVPSLKYWLDAAGITESNKKKHTALSDFGNQIQKYDPFLEKDLSWELIHANLVANMEYAPLFWILFNRLPTNAYFSKDSFVDDAQKFFYEHKADDVKVDYIADDFSVLTRSYLRGKKEDPEDNAECPLSRLGLIKEEEKSAFSKKGISLRILSPFVVYFTFHKAVGKKDSIAFEDAVELIDGPCRLFNLDRSSFMAVLMKLANKNYLSVIKTAGLNTIYFNKKEYSLEDVFKDDLEVKQ